MSSSGCIDTHCHLNSQDYFADLDDVINESKKAGVMKFVVPATCPDDIGRTIEIAEQYDCVYAAVGVHPHDASKLDDAVLEKIKILSKREKVVAIGEIGLDYYYNLSPQSEQKQALTKQIEIALEGELPIILHNRNSDGDMLDILHEYAAHKHFGGVMHCFSSDVDMLKCVLDMGLYVSYTANITFAKTNLDEQIQNTPLDKLLLETDSPYMTPPPNRGQRNTPKATWDVAKYIAKIKYIGIDEVIEMTNKNAQKLFKLMLIIISCLVAGWSAVYAQSDKTEYYDGDDYDYEQPDVYVRRIGFGPVIGTNTIVDRYTTGLKSFSQEGLLSSGAQLNIRIIEPLIFQVCYNYSENKKVYNQMPDSIKKQPDSLRLWPDPSYHNAVEFSFIYMLKPRNMVNFYGSAGATYFMNNLSRIRKLPETNTYYKERWDNSYVGLNAGIGAFVNFDLGSGGTIAINAEWKLGFSLADTKLDYDPRKGPDDADYFKGAVYSTMTSIPRGGIIWYIPWVK